MKAFSLSPTLPLPPCLPASQGLLQFYSVSSAPFLLDGVIEISKLYRWVEISQLVFPESKRGPRSKEKVKELLRCRWNLSAQPQKFTDPGGMSTG